MKNIKITLIMYLALANILVFDQIVIAGSGKGAVTDELNKIEYINIDEKVFEGTVVRYFRKLVPGSASIELLDLPQFVNVKDNVTGKVYESFQISNYLENGKDVKYFIRNEKVKIIEELENTWELHEGEVMKSYSKYVFGSPTTEVDNLHQIVEIKDNKTGKIIESSPLINKQKSGDKVKFFINNGKALVVIE